MIQMPLLFRQKHQKPMNLHQLHSVPVPLEKDMYEEKHCKHTLLKFIHESLALTDETYIHLYIPNGCFLYLKP